MVLLRMISHIIIGDITDPENRRDIIIGMNPKLDELTALGRQFIGDHIPTRLHDLGSILTFEFDNKRFLHMIVCHTLELGGWKEAPIYLRYGLDTLFVQDRNTKSTRQYSIVQVGAGEVGQKYGADVTALQAAMGESALSLTLYQRPAGALAPALNLPPLKLLFGHNPRRVAVGPY